MALNKITLDVSGRLSLLGPQPEVLQILKRAGIHNILRIFDNETELLKTSEDIILQTSSFRLGDLKNLAQQEPQSEFDQLRSEIGSVFGGSSSEIHEEAVPPPPKTKTISPAYQDPRFAQTQPPVTNPPASSIEQEFDDAFRQFEPEATSDFSGEAPNQFRSASSQNNYIPPPPPTRGVYPQSGQFQNRQYAPQQPVAPVPPRPMAPQPPVFDSSQKPPVRQNSDFSAVRTERFQPSAPVPPRPAQPAVTVPPVAELDDINEELSSRSKPSKAPVSDDSFDESDDEFFEEGKKKSPVPMLVIIVVLLALGGLGVFLASNMLSKKPALETAVTTTQQTQQAVPAVVDTPKAATPVITEPVKENPEPAVVAEKKEEPRVREAPRASKPRPRAEPRSNRVSTPAPAAPAAADNKVVITSTPSGAKVTINGDYLGITPYTWDKPIFGPLSVVVSKDGYEDDSKVFEFTGGSVRESFSLRKAAIPTPPPPAISEPEPEPEPYNPPVSKYTPEPEPVASTPASRPTPEPTPVSSSFSGGDASIFIASIPPVADVFLDGKLIGKTNVSEIKLPAGTHNLKFVKGVKETTKAITVQPGKNPSQMVRLQ